MDERESEAEPLGEWTMPTATISGAEAGAWRGGGGREKGGATGPRGRGERAERGSAAARSESRGHFSQITVSLIFAKLSGAKEKENQESI
jgi:hypothetical protein